MKEAYIFDLDDTLIHSNSHIYVYDHQQLLVDKISSREYVHKRSVIKEYASKGYHINSDEFGGDGLCNEANELSLEYLMKGQHLMDQISILRKKSKEEQVDIYLVTGRANKRETLQHLIQTRFQVHIPLDHIYPVSNKMNMNELWYRLHKEEHYGVIHLLENGKSAANFKKASLYDILRKRYEKVYFYDDDFDNIVCFDNLVEELRVLGYRMQGKSYLIKTHK
jgi:hypothetical protein